MEFQWITLEQAKHGMLHVRFTWLNLSSSANDLAAVRKIPAQKILFSYIFIIYLYIFIGTFVTGFNRNTTVTRYNIG